VFQVTEVSFLLFLKAFGQITVTGLDCIVSGITSFVKFEQSGFNQIIVIFQEFSM
jgi:hypothetical protein